MSFDPEKVSRWICTGKDDCEKDANGDCVAAEDYDQLLALYREAIADRPVTWDEAVRLQCPAGDPLKHE